MRALVEEVFGILAWFDDRTPAFRCKEAMGPKALSLALLAEAGFPVPNGFVVTTDALSRHVRNAPGHAGPGEAPDPEWIRETPLSACVTDPLTGALETLRKAGATHVAVRSSAVAEDLEDASFAGQYETVLGVQIDRPAAVEAAIRQCWASFYAAHAVAYSRGHGIRSTEPGMAVCIQRLIDADVAGVAFGVHPVTGDPNTVVINASVGLGEAVVAGLVTPDTYLCHSDGQIERELGDKTVKVVRRREGWTETVATPACEQQEYCLSDAQAAEVADLTLRSGAYFGQPADVEFAVADGRLWLLQSRPITTKTAARVAVP